MSAYGPGTQVYRYEEGNFIVDLLDASTYKLVWRGWARVDLVGTLDEPAALHELLGSAIDEMFAYFPIPEGTAPVYVEQDEEQEVEVEQHD
jgi:hypothetical protein